MVCVKKYLGVEFGLFALVTNDHSRRLTAWQVLVAVFGYGHCGGLRVKSICNSEWGELVYQVGSRKYRVSFCDMDRSIARVDLLPVWA